MKELFTVTPGCSDLNRFSDGHGLPSQLRFVDLQILSDEQFAIRRDDIPFFQEDNISWHELCLVQLHGPAVALGGHLLADEGGEFFDSLLGSVFQHKAEEGVDH